MSVTQIVCEEEGSARQRLPCFSLSPSRPPHAIFSPHALPPGSQSAEITSFTPLAVCAETTFAVGFVIVSKLV